jgi:two-component system, LuxR family, sensor kinase FixL
MFLANVPIRRKLMMAFLLTSGVVLLLTCVSFVAYEVITLRKGMISGLTTRAEIIAANSTGSLAFQNETDAAEVLSALKMDKRILSACLYDERGKLFAKYPSDAPTGIFPAAPGESGYRDNYLEIFRPVVKGSRALGVVYLKSDLSALTDRYRAYAWLAAAIVAGALLVSYLLSRLLQQQISLPILALADTARAISNHRDFAVRAKKLSEDELGLLTDAFNQMLEALQEKTRLLDSVMGNMSEGIVVADKTGRMVYFNKGAERIIGIGMSEKASSEWTREYGVFKEDKVTPFEESELPLVKAVKGIPSIGVIQFLRNSGHPEGIFISVNGTPMQNVKGEVDGGLVVVRDITREKKLEEVTKAQSFMTSVLENVPNMIFVKDAKDLRFVMFNKAGEELLGMPKTDLIGKNDYDFFPKEDADFFTSKDRKVLEGKKLLDIPEENLKTKSKGERILHTKKIPLLGADGNPQYLLGISEDITEQRRQEAMKVYTKALETSNKEMQDFIFVVSHDLQEPLRKIQAFGNFLRDELGTGLAATAADYLARMQDASKRMSLLIEDLLQLTRVTSRAKPFEPVDLKEIIGEVTGDLEIRLKETGGKVQVSGLSKIEADPSQMRQLFQNLIGNALKFHKPGSAPLIEISGEVNKGERDHHIRVKDNGIGFDQKYSEKIFNIFQRLNGAEYEGTGIGLAICRKVVERHGGKIKASSKPGEGAVFEITLPLHQIRQGETT